MNLKSLALAATLAVASLTAFATPQYNGQTTATNITNSQMTTGYYIWNTDTASRNWHIRWTSTNANSGNKVSWFGDIFIQGNGLDSASAFSFESNDSLSTPSFSSTDIIDWVAYTNDTGGVDGIDFTIDQDVSLIKFSLGSSLFSGLELNSSDPGVTGTNIFIGENFATPNVLVERSNTGTFQSFEVNVDEPATLALLGIGLAGLGFARRKQAKS
tara:strand:- start:26 stop:670 length:645 start_codon:yes stop_codon:yes gene_type:complete